MKQVVLRNGQAVVEEVPAPALLPGSLLVRVAYSCISPGTETATMSTSDSKLGLGLIRRALRQPDKVRQVISSVRTRGFRATKALVEGKLAFGSVVGYSCAGIVGDIAEGVDGFRPGDRVACAGSAYANRAEMEDYRSLEVHGAKAAGVRTTLQDKGHRAEIGGRRIGGSSDLTTFSFHPVKHITAGEGGMVTTTRKDLAERLRRFRNHGIEREVRQRQMTWRQDMVDFGFNYRLSDRQSALGSSQLRRLDERLKRREEIAGRYTEAFAAMPEVSVAPTCPGTRHAWHIYPLRLNRERLREDREKIFRALRAENIGVSVHSLPVHLHPYYRDRLGTRPAMCPAAEAAFDQLLTLLLFPSMSDDDLADVIAAVGKVIRWARC